MIKITKAKLTKELMVVLSFKETLEDGTIKEHENVKCNWIAHEDLQNAFRALDPHIPFIMELPEAVNRDLEGLTFVGDIKVSTFIIVGEDEGEGCILVYSRSLSTGKSDNNNTPFYKWNDEQPYQYMDELAELIYVCQEETRLYYEGKSAPKRQLEFGFGEAQDHVNEDDLHIEEEGITIKKKSGRKKSEEA